MNKLTFLVLAFLALTFFNANANTNCATIETGIVVDEYVKIKSSELPPPVVEEILKQYPTSKLRQAYKYQNKYKLIMVLSSGTARTVYIDANGRWIIKKKR